MERGFASEERKGDQRRGTGTSSGPLRHLGSAGDQAAGAGSGRSVASGGDSAARSPPPAPPRCVAEPHAALRRLVRMSSTPLADQPRPTTSLPSSYVPADVEGPLYERWVDRGYFTVDPASGKPPYCIVIPPPNVTGSLHLGHALPAHAHGRPHPPPAHAGLRGALAAGHGPRRHRDPDPGRARSSPRPRAGASTTTRREEFVAKVWEWKAEYGGKILGQMRRLGDGVDWTRERFTMDEGLSRAVQTIFKRLYDDGLIYRAERIINWCPRCLTALSDIEVDHHDDDGELVSIRYGEGDDARRRHHPRRDHAGRHRRGRASRRRAVHAPGRHRGRRCR